MHAYSKLDGRSGLASGIAVYDGWGWFSVNDGGPREGHPEKQQRQQQQQRVARRLEDKNGSPVAVMVVDAVMAPVTASVLSSNVNLLVLANLPPEPATTT